MYLDGNTIFTGTAGLASAMTDSPTAGTQVSTNVLDLLNARDLGIGDDPALKLLIEVITAFTVGTSLQVNLQGAPDNGAGAPGAYTTMWSSIVFTEAQLTAGVYIGNVDMPRILGPTGLQATAAQALPRFLRLQYVSVGNHSTGSIVGAIVLDRQDQMSYPPGIVIAN